MRREIAISATAFAALVLALLLVAGSGMAQMNLGTIGTLQDADNIQNVTVQECQDAWATSEAYGECGDRSPVEPAGQPETFDTVGNLCVIATSCEAYVAQQTDTQGVAKLILSRTDLTWSGGLTDAGRLKNCKGLLSVVCP